MDKRYAGILLPITALPSPYGVGTLGKEAYQFADTLKEAGQNLWQILPLGPTGDGDSPYQTFSAYAGSPYLIDLDTLIDEKFLSKEDVVKYDWGQDVRTVDYAKLNQYRFTVLKQAFDNFKKFTDKTEKNAYDKFVKDNEKWLKDYAMYMAIKKDNEEKSWVLWTDEDIKQREPKAMEEYSLKYKEEIEYWSFIQYLFFKQWTKLRKYVNDLGIIIVGDIPIYVSMDSSDVWANPDVFWLDENRVPVKVAGCPPDFFAAEGQLWGNPLYDWEYLKSTNYKWWFERISINMELFDMIRIDHFRGLDTYYTIPYGAKNAIEGQWVDGPGIDFFNCMKKELGDVPIIAEDLGFSTPSVIKLLEDSGYPGMKVLEFAFDSADSTTFMPHRYKPNSIVYSGTHDNNTFLGWLSEASEHDRNKIINYCRLSEEEGYNWGVIRAVYETVCNYAIVQMQDVLGLSSEARMNIPSTLGGNWLWRMKKDDFKKEYIEKLNKLSKTYERN